MTACYTAAANDATTTAQEKATAKAACKTSGKTALGRSLGKKTADVTAADVDEAIDKAGKQKVAGIVDACSKAAAGDAAKLAACSKDTVTRRGTVKSPAKRAIEEATGKTTVTDVDVKEFVHSGGRDELGEKQEACMSVAGDETAKIAACDTEGKKNFAKVLGKPESEVDDVDFAEGKRDAAMSTVKDAMEGCIGSIDSTATTQQKATAKKACKTTNAKKALKETLGSKSSEISDEDTEVY